MGSGVSREDAEKYLSRQEQLISKLTALIEAKKGLGATNGTNGRNATSSNAPAWLSCASNSFDVQSSGRSFDIPTEIHDEIFGLAERSRAAERRRVEPLVEEYEREQPNTEWTAPTAEEAASMKEIRPWLSVMTQPQGFSYNQTDTKPVGLQLELEHVYGFRSTGVRNAVRWAQSSSRRIVYFAGAVAVVHDVTDAKQTFFREHQEEITSMTLSKDGTLAATGDQGKYPSVYIWDVETKAVKVKLSGLLRRAVVSLAFSDCGNFLAAVGLDDAHTIAVYDWRRGKLIAEGIGGTACRLLEISPNRETATKDAFPFLTVGERSATWWSFDKNKVTTSRGSLQGKPLLLGLLGDQQTFLTALSTSQFTVIGTQNGELYVCADMKLGRVVDAHHGPVTSIRGNPSGSVLLTGGYDGYMCRWSTEHGFKRLSAQQISAHSSDDLASLPLTFYRPNSIRGLDIQANPLTGAVEQILVECVSGTIHSIDAVHHTESLLVSAHGGDLTTPNYVGELSGLAVHPTESRFVSIGETTAFLWDALTRKAVRKIRLPARGQCATWSPNGKFITVGLHNGAFLVFNPNLELLKEVRASNRRVQCLRFSSDSSILAVGTADNVVQLYDATAGAFEAGGKLSGPNGVILSIDFSIDNKLLQCSTQAFELVYFDIHSLKMLSDDAARALSNVHWSTFSSLLGWNVQGIWPHNSQLDDVNSVCVSDSGELIATAEETGLVKVFQFPCVGGGLDKEGALHKRPDCLRVFGHGGKVSQVRWLSQGNFIISSGGEDLSCFQWKVVSR
jgi:microtubule-associated protein-like 6